MNRNIFREDCVKVWGINKSIMFACSFYSMYIFLSFMEVFTIWISSLEGSGTHHSYVIKYSSHSQVLLSWCMLPHSLQAMPTHTVYPMTLHWRHNGNDSVSNHQPHHCLLNRLFGRKSKKISKLRITGLCAGPVNSPHKWPVTWKMFPFDDVIMKYGHSLFGFG